MTKQRKSRMPDLYEDKKLTTQLLIHATGSDIHRLAGLVNAYRCYIAAHNRQINLHRHDTKRYILELEQILQKEWGQMRLKLGGIS